MEEEVGRRNTGNRRAPYPGASRWLESLIKKSTGLIELDGFFGKRVNEEERVFLSRLKLLYTINIRRRLKRD